MDIKKLLIIMTFLNTFIYIGDFIMRKKNYLYFLFLMLITANNVSASEDQLSTLILKVNAKSSSNAEIDLMENKLDRTPAGK